MAKRICVKCGRLKGSFTYRRFNRDLHGMDPLCDDCNPRIKRPGKVMA